MVSASVFDTNNTLSKRSYKSTDGVLFLFVFHESDNPRALRGVSPMKRAIKHAPSHSRFNSSDCQVSREPKSWEDFMLARLEDRL